MNKITPHLLRDLHKTLPEGTECYLCAAVRRALAIYRKGREPAAFLQKDEALSVLPQKLGRGLKRFFINDIQAALDAIPEN
ncbi:MAG: hypothetical protein Q7T40_00180 [Methylobacter sp.]|nr:hypothetical protein [Methylobacter sp.]